MVVQECSELVMKVLRPLDALWYRIKPMAISTVHTEKQTELTDD